MPPRKTTRGKAKAVVIDDGPHTLYVNNLYEKISESDVKQALQCMFSRYGTILDIIYRKTYKLRGQAWVVFEKSEDATTAKEQLDGFPFMNKPIRIQFAKVKSDAVARLDGTYSEEEVEARRQKRRDAWAAKRAARTVAGLEDAGEPAVVEHVGGNKRTILVENIPKEANEGMLLLVFQRFPGLKEVRMAGGKTGVAYVEYDHEAGAAAAVAGLQGFKLATDKPMRLSIQE